MLSAVITQLAEAPLIARMQDALAGEMSRRPATADGEPRVSVTAYQRARQAGAASLLPILFIVVDGFSELLSQHPSTCSSRSVGWAGRWACICCWPSQRLDEGRLRGLETPICPIRCAENVVRECATCSGRRTHISSTPIAGRCKREPES